MSTVEIALRVEIERLGTMLRDVVSVADDGALDAAIFSKHDDCDPECNACCADDCDCVICDARRVVASLEGPS